MSAHPSPLELRQAREAAGLTQGRAAGLVGSSLRAWSAWETGDRRMPVSKWELFRIKIARETERK